MDDYLNSVKKRLEKRSYKNGECIETDYPCWGRYQCMKFKKTTIGTHRASWMVNNGEIPKGIFVCHSCDNPRCINPLHLFLGTPKDNIQDMIHKKRDNMFGARKYTFEQWDKVVELKKNNKTYDEISEITGVNRSSIISYITKHHRKLVRKIPLEIRKEAKRLRGNGMLCKEIQEKLSLSKRTLTRILQENI